MSLTASMWTGVTGLMAHGERMNVIGNNISNVNTVGFKSQRMDFADFIYRDRFTMSGMEQVGRGTRIGAIMGDFSSSAFENSNHMTDLAIGGSGFFRVKPVGSEMEYYTRAGNFRFNAEGYLMDPNGNVVQGWKINPDGTSTADALGSGALTDVRLNMAKLDPLQTSKLTVQANLSRNIGSDKSTNPDNPLTALLNHWDAQAKEPLSKDFYSYSTSVNAYDEAGMSHEITIYFDQIDPDTIKGKPGERMWEYVVAMEPDEDMRQVAVARPDGQGHRIVNMSDTRYGGVLMAGTLTFDGTGKLSTMSAYTLQGNHPTDDGNSFVQDADGKPVPKMDAANIANSLFPARVSKDGFPVLTANFTGLPGANTTSGLPRSSRSLMEIDFGLKATNPDNPWNSSLPLSLALSPADGAPDAGGADGAAAAVAAAGAAGGLTRAGAAGARTFPGAAVDPVSGRDLFMNDVRWVGNQALYRSPRYWSGSTEASPYVYKTPEIFQQAREIALYNAAQRAIDVGDFTTDDFSDLATLATLLTAQPGQPDKIEAGDWPLTEMADEANAVPWKKYDFSGGIGVPPPANGSDEGCDDGPPPAAEGLS